MYIYYDNLINDSLINPTKPSKKPGTTPYVPALPLITIWSFSSGQRALFDPASRIHVPLDMFPTLAMNPFPSLTSRPTFLCEIGL
jgi:hypothetical protein